MQLAQIQRAVLGPALSPKATACCVTAVTVVESSVAATCCRCRRRPTVLHRWAGSSAARPLIAAVLLHALLHAVARLIAAAESELGVRFGGASRLRGSEGLG